MEELRDLNQMAINASNRFSVYDGQDFVLPQLFKDKVKEINSNTIVYNHYSAVIETKGYQNGTLNIYMPNQWFYVASYFTDLYCELMKYKRLALQVATKERLKILNGSSLNEEETATLQSLDLSIESKEKLSRFITDYTWWGGAKTIDRGDFYVSPILSHAKLVNASQSFVADLCAFLSDKKDLVDVILKSEYMAMTGSSTNSQQTSFQQIFYGAPGTGKSNKIKEEVDNLGKIHFRTTFHPDSDYSTFVGCYKPKSHKKNMLNGNGINETQLLSSFFDSNSFKYNRMNKARYLYEALVHTKDIRDLGLDAHMVAEKLKEKGFTGCAYTTEATCMYNIFDWLKEDGYIVENKITYEFTPQAFLKAYTEAWKHQATGDPVYLIIEEINRGNCAQIFGDIFQLLDRDPQGFSRYEISPDSDIQDYIGSLGLSISGIVNSEGKDVSAEIASGEILKLPDNLYIWATMNTSDQSLFPIDSAFKRRWEWKYIKIKEGKDENGNKLDWKVDVKMDEAGTLLPWWDFIRKINEIIASMTSSADKQLGYFFCCAKDGVIDVETFVSKVIFYLWNDVFKDYGFEDASLFRYTTKDEDGKDLEKDLTFPDFYDEEGEKVNTEHLTDFVKKVMNWKKTNAEQD